MSPLSHMKWMLFGGGGLVVVALLFGVPLQSALFVGILLACPLMMILMMGGLGGGHDHGQSDGQDSETQRPDDHRTYTTHRM